MSAPASPPPAWAQGASIEVAADLHDERDDDADSTLGSTASSTTSVTESIYAYRKLHGRTYANVKTAEYYAPNDEQQNEGLEMMHISFTHLLGGRLHILPLGKDFAGRVLDVGTGTGIWAIDFADEHPAATVVGSDISPIQPAAVPPNAFFVIDDCQLDWTWPEDHFDFIHARLMYGSIADWSAFYGRVLKHLKPGGWFQNLEFEILIQSDHVQNPPIFKQWADTFYRSGDVRGYRLDPAVGHFMRDILTAAGFADVAETKLKLPMHAWPADPKLKEAGLLMEAALDQSLEGFITFLCDQVLNWSREDTLAFAAQMRAEMRKKSNCGYIIVTVVTGRKPSTLA